VQSGDERAAELYLDLRVSVMLQVAPPDMMPTPPQLVDERPTERPTRTGDEDLGHSLPRTRLIARRPMRYTATGLAHIWLAPHGPSWRALEDGKGLCAPLFCSRRYVGERVLRITFSEGQVGDDLAEFFRRSDCAVERAGEHALEVTPRLPLLDFAARLEIEGLLRVWCKLHPESPATITPFGGGSVSEIDPGTRNARGPAGSVELAGSADS
jgi:hypothetical protein